MPDDEAKSDGVKLGEAVAIKVVMARANDGADDPRVDDPLEAGSKLIVMRSIRNDPLAACTIVGRSMRRSTTPAAPSSGISKLASVARARSIPRRKRLMVAHSRTHLRSPESRLAGVYRELGAGWLCAHPRRSNPRYDHGRNYRSPRLLRSLLGRGVRQEVLRLSR